MLELLMDRTVGGGMVRHDNHPAVKMLLQLRLDGCTGSHVKGYDLLGPKMPGRSPGDRRKIIHVVAGERGARCRIFERFGNRSMGCNRLSSQPGQRPPAQRSHFPRHKLASDGVRNP